MNQVQAKTIQDFGEQWVNFSGANEGYYCSLEFLRDFVAPLEVEGFAGKRIIDIGSGTGRIVKMLHMAGPQKIYAYEPSAAYEKLVQNTRDISDTVEYRKDLGENLRESDVDYVISFGVVHHIPEPDPTMRAAHRALRPGGKVVLWLYGKEGNELYLSLVEPLRKITTRVPHSTLKNLSVALSHPLNLYIWLCRYLPLPMRRYMRDNVGKLSPIAKVMTIYDQLNPAYAKYYTRAEAIDLLARAGFKNIVCRNRHGYSWTVIGEK